MGTSLEPGREYDTAVVGAGITGITTALLLARSGQRVVLLEARTPGAVATGNTTGKLSLLQGSTLSRVRQHQGDAVLTAHVTANLAAQDWLIGYFAERDVTYQVRTAYSYATTEAGRHILERELAAMQAAGLNPTWVLDPGLPYDVTASIALPDQAQFHPMELLGAMLTEYEELGGTLHLGCRYLTVDVGSPCGGGPPRGGRRADRLVLATGTPVLDRGGYFARLKALRSYAVACRVTEPVPEGMYLSVDDPTRSLRTALTSDGEFFIIGGNGHAVGRRAHTERSVADLEHWGSQYFPTASFTHAWSAQDYRPISAIPYVGTLGWSGDKVAIATGYDKWGMTNGVAAALRLAGELTGASPSWAEPLATLPPRALSLVDGFDLGALVAARMGGGWVDAARHTMPDAPPAEGQGVVARSGASLLARSTVDGETCTVSAICTHMGGVLSWNGAERSWDCPLHGSRFSADGKVLEGPATKDLDEA
jgi:glycine/D-amino acid oxidase-like deaminating enzyme/nitrite reductase/ring-hydroxylating ferredoxin subunit